MENRERELTAAELKRKAEFEKICEKMAQNGYVKTDLIISILKANILALVVMLPFLAVLFVIYFVVNPANITSLYFGLRGFFLLLIAYFPMIVLHELIHGLVFGIFAENHFKSIRFGVIWTALTPYCSCSGALKKGQYVVGSVMPTVILGFLPAIISVITGSLFLLLLSAFMIIGGGGDFLITLKLLRHKSQGKEALYYDHPYECGVVAFEK